MEFLNTVIKQYEDSVYFCQPSAKQLNHIYELLRSCSLAKSQSSYPPNIVISACRIFINKVCTFYSCEKDINETSLKQHLSVIDLLLATKQAAQETCIKEIINHIVNMVLDPSCIFWICFHLIKLANDILISQNFKCGNKTVGFDAVQCEFSIWKLMDHLMICGDYTLQSSILELLFRLKKDIKSDDTVAAFFPKHTDLQEALAAIRSSSFDTDCRTFLNAVNSYVKKVFSLEAEFIKADDHILLPPSNFQKSSLRGSNNLWVDFNTVGQSVSIQVSINSIIPVKLHEDDCDLEMLVIQESAIEKIYRKRLKDGDVELDVLFISLSHPMKVQNELCNQFAKTCRLLKLAFKIDENLSYLHDVILGIVFKNKYNTKSAITLDKKPQVAPLLVTVVSKSSKSIYTSISEKSLGGMIQADVADINKNFTFKTCPETTNEPFSDEVSDDSANNKKCFKPKRKTPSVLESICEDDELHVNKPTTLISNRLVCPSVNEQCIHYTDIKALSSGTEQRSDVVSSLWYSPTVPIIDEQIQDSPKYDYDDDIIETLSDIVNIDDDGPEPFQMEDEIAEEFQTILNLPEATESASNYSFKSASKRAKSPLLASKTNSEISGYSRRSARLLNRRVSRKCDCERAPEVKKSTVVVLQNMKLTDNISVKKRNRLMLRKRSSGKISLGDDEKIIRTPDERTPVKKLGTDLKEKRIAKATEENKSGAAKEVRANEFEKSLNSDKCIQEDDFLADKDDSNDYKFNVKKAGFKLNEKTLTELKVENESYVVKKGNIKNCSSNLKENKKTEFEQFLNSEISTEEGNQSDVKDVRKKSVCNVKNTRSNLKHKTIAEAQDENESRAAKEVTTQGKGNEKVVGPNLKEIRKMEDELDELLNSDKSSQGEKQSPMKEVRKKTKLNVKNTRSNFKGKTIAEAPDGKESRTAKEVKTRGRVNKKIVGSNLKETRETEEKFEEILNSEKSLQKKQLHVKEVRKKTKLNVKNARSNLKYKTAAKSPDEKESCVTKEVKAHAKMNDKLEENRKAEDELEKLLNTEQSSKGDEPSPLKVVRKKSEFNVNNSRSSKDVANETEENVQIEDQSKVNQSNKYEIIFDEMLSAHKKKLQNDNSQIGGSKANGMQKNQEKSSVQSKVSQVGLTATQVNLDNSDDIFQVVTQEVINKDVGEKENRHTIHEQSTNKSCKSSVLTEKFTKTFKKLLQEKDSNKRKRDNQSELDTSEKDPKRRRKLFNPNHSTIYFDPSVNSKSHRSNYEDEEVSQEELDSKKYLFNKLIDRSEMDRKIPEDNAVAAVVGNDKLDGLKDTKLAHSTPKPKRKYTRRKPKLEKIPKPEPKPKRKYTRKSKLNATESTVPLDAVVSKSEAEGYDRVFSSQSISHHYHHHRTTVFSNYSTRMTNNPQAQNTLRKLFKLHKDYGQHLTKLQHELFPRS